MATLHPIVLELVEMIKTNGWQDKFQQALDNCKAQNVVEFDEIKTLEDYYQWLNNFLTWIPVENRAGTKMYNMLGTFYFLLDMPPVRELQTPFIPENKEPKLSPLSKWIQQFAIALGKWLDTPDSITPESVQSFYDAPRFNMEEYLQPRGGWKTYNDWFARTPKPGARPIAAPLDDRVVVSPADSTNAGQWWVGADSQVDIKGIEWRIDELLEGSPYKDAFKGGIWIHQFLNTTDYHRQHAPVGGKVVEARFIQGQAYLQVTAEPIPGDPTGRNHVVLKRQFDIPDTPGYQFMQARGLVVIDSPIGLVAVLPMGMAQVSSVIMTTEVGRTIAKGDEISYFQFGGSDIVVIFQQQSNVSITAQRGVHYKVGQRIAEAYPVCYPAR